MPHRIQTLRHDLLRAISEVEAYVAGKSLADLLADRGLQLILEREFEIIGEALYRLRSLDPVAFATIAVGPRIIGMRNILAHGYVRVDHAILWDAATRELAPLRAQIEDLP